MQKISTMQAFSNEILKEQKLTIGWIWAIARVRTVS